MSVKRFAVTVEFPMGATWTRLTRELAAVRAEDAVERVFQQLGSRHRIERRRVKIVSVKELREE